MTWGWTLNLSQRRGHQERERIGMKKWSLFRDLDDKTESY
jgi:hypothetical protein